MFHCVGMVGIVCLSSVVSHWKCVLFPSLAIMTHDTVEGRQVLGVWGGHFTDFQRIYQREKPPAWWLGLAVWLLGPPCQRQVG